MTPSSPVSQGVVTLHVNGQGAQVDAALHDTLLTVLRDRLQLTAAKRGCNQGVCGACTVSVDGVPMRACLSLAHNCESAEVQTLEGLLDCPHMQALQTAFAHTGAFQCGFCTPGMLVSARSLLQRDPDPDERAIRTALSGNLCRCTGYVKIVEAVQAAARSLLAEGAAS
ncbi:(2Fe-2S)-binding protein [Variovorax sp. J22R24]|uniref:(2Fe-2S)-binding protein n=1 Tax=Variovorax gracilis TaxID=3053502 RepID=UPI0025780E01|nr:(2Fe-2S)-binding protein [Variovorax sp. J22R24]MDM0108059.1 (2Fe-2S)-binding protein [Variovorax sp. J22R24]